MILLKTARGRRSLGKSQTSPFTNSIRQGRLPQIKLRIPPARYHSIELGANGVTTSTISLVSRSVRLWTAMKPDPSWACSISRSEKVTSVPKNREIGLITMPQTRVFAKVLEEGQDLFARGHHYFVFWKTRMTQRLMRILRSGIRGKRGDDIVFGIEDPQRNIGLSEELRKVAHTCPRGDSLPKCRTSGVVAPFERQFYYSSEARCCRA